GTDSIGRCELWNFRFVGAVGKRGGLSCSVMQFTAPISTRSRPFSTQWTRPVTRCSLATKPRSGLRNGRLQLAFSSANPGLSGPGRIYPGGEVARGAGFAIVLECPANGRKGELLPGDLLPQEKPDLKAF